MAEERDFIMARLAAGRAHASRITAGIESCIDFFIYPDEDENGESRKEVLDEILDDIGGLTRSVDAAQTLLNTLNESELKEEEPDLPEGDGFDEDDEDAEDSDSEEDDAA